MNKKIKNLLLWVALLPASFLGMVLSSILWRFLHAITASRYIDTGSWLNIFFAEVMGNLMAGGAFVLIGYKIAPSNKQGTAIALTALSLLMGGASLFIVNFTSKEYFSNIGILAQLVGSIVCCISAYRGELDKTE